MTSKVLGQFRQLAQGQHGEDFLSLNERELEILRLVAQGATNSAIAEKLCYSEHTVKHMVSEIIQKLHVKNRAEAAAYAVKAALITPDL